MHHSKLKSITYLTRYLVRFLDDNSEIYMTILYDQLLFLYVCLSESRYWILGKMAPTVTKNFKKSKSN